MNKTQPKKAFPQRPVRMTIEYHYPDGDIGAHPLTVDLADPMAMASYLDPMARNPVDFIVIRRHDKHSQARTLSLRSNEQALLACRLLKDAYDAGLARGGSVDWEDINAAHNEACEALLLSAGKERTASRKAG